MEKFVKKFIEPKSTYVYTSEDFIDLPPRNIFKDRLFQSVAFARRYHFKVAVIAIDLNTFTEQNGASTSDITDKILIQVGDRILHTLRETDTICSQGVDEFIVILPDVREEQDAFFVANKISTLFVDPLQIKGKELHIKPFIGISMYPTDTLDPEQLIINANIAMEEARQHNKSIVRVHHVAQSE
jgi:diguanylate cyclase (GGDEF)-like protein